MAAGASRPRPGATRRRARRPRRAATSAAAPRALAARADGDGGEARPIPEPIYLAVDDLEATVRAAKAAGARLSPDVVPDVGPLGQIAQRPWGERSFYAADPFGNPLCFVSRDSVFTG
jgi:hypothetical protein